MKDIEPAKESRKISLINTFFTIGMVVIYITMLLKFIPLWDERNRESALVFFLAAIMFNSALLSGIDNKELLKKSFWISVVFYLSMPIVAAVVDLRLRLNEFGIEIVSIAVIFLIKYIIIVLPKVKKPS